MPILNCNDKAIGLFPLFLFSCFPLQDFTGNRAKWLFIPLIAITFFITANSDSQTAFLAMLLGTIVFIFAYFYKYDGRKLIFAVTAIGLLFSPLIFLKSFENNFVQNYAPQIIKQKASGEYREWIYYTYANEALSRPLVGHGLTSTKNFSPDNLDNYKKLAQERNVSHSLVHAHNFPLQVIFEFGYLGAILFLAAFWWLLNFALINWGVQHMRRPSRLYAACYFLPIHCGKAGFYLV